MNHLQMLIRKHGLYLLVGILIGANFHLFKNAKANTSTLSGTCGFVMTPQRWGWTPIADGTTEYDSITYGVINFDNQTVTSSQGKVTPNAGDAEPSYSEAPFSYNFNPHQLAVPNSWRLSLVSGGVETGDSVNVVATNGGTTFLIADMRAGGTGICQKI